MKKILFAVLLLTSVNVFAYGSAETRKNWDGSYTTQYSDGSRAETRENWDGSTTTTWN